MILVEDAIVRALNMRIKLYVQAKQQIISLLAYFTPLRCFQQILLSKDLGSC